MYEAPRPHPPIPDFAIDRHTNAGRKRRRGWRHFWEAGATLENKANLSDPYEEIAKATRTDAAPIDR